MNCSFDLPQCDDQDGYCNGDVSALLNAETVKEETRDKVLREVLGGMGVSLKMVRGVQANLLERSDRRKQEKADRKGR